MFDKWGDVATKPAQGLSLREQKTQLAAPTADKRRKRGRGVESQARTKAPISGSACGKSPGRRREKWDCIYAFGGTEGARTKRNGRKGWRAQKRNPIRSLLLATWRLRGMAAAIKSFIESRPDPNEDQGRGAGRLI